MGFAGDMMGDITFFDWTFKQKDTVQFVKEFVNEVKSLVDDQTRCM